MTDGATRRLDAALNPRTTQYHFFGPLGALAISLTAPIIVYILSFNCSESAGGCPRSWTDLPLEAISEVMDSNWWRSVWDGQAFAVYTGWYIFCVIAWAALPGDWIQGLPLRSGGQQKYKINGFGTLLLAIGLSVGTIINFGPSSFTYIHDHYIGLITAGLIHSFVQAFLWYALSFQPGKLLALGGNTGNPIYDWFLGRELNPTLGSLDIKSFNELRPGMILWALINLSMACEQATRLSGAAPGSFFNLTDSMWLVLFFQGWYIADALYNEPSILTVMDITTDGFGFMLSVGDLVWVPFTYSIQARYLVWHPIELGPIRTAIIFGIHAIGYWIFRASNAEKNDFRNGRNPKGLRFMETRRGTKLLTTGWWGRSRHPNYLGDLIMAFTWSLPTGFNTPFTYFYFIYFIILLVHRERRDDEHCAEKYGEDWEKYKKLVPYRIVPKIY